jgi:hypothetical protein
MGIRRRQLQIPLLHDDKFVSIWHSNAELHLHAQKMEKMILPMLSETSPRHLPMRSFFLSFLSSSPAFLSLFSLSCLALFQASFIRFFVSSHLLSFFCFVSPGLLGSGLFCSGLSSGLSGTQEDLVGSGFVLGGQALHLQSLLSLYCPARHQV